MSLHGCHLLQEGDPFQGPKLGSCLTLRNELSEETHVLTKQEISLERAPGGEQEGTGTREDCSLLENKDIALGQT